MEIGRILGGLAHATRCLCGPDANVQIILYGSDGNTTICAIRQHIMVHDLARRVTISYVNTASNSTARLDVTARSKMPWEAALPCEARPGLSARGMRM